MASGWVTFRDSVIGGIFGKKDIVNAGNFANEISDEVKITLGTTIEGIGFNSAVETVYETVTDRLEKRGWKYAKSPALKDTIIELIQLNRGLIEDSEKYRMNEDYKSQMKKQIAMQYAAFTLKILGKVIGYLLEKYLTKGLIK